MDKQRSYPIKTRVPSGTFVSLKQASVYYQLSVPKTAQYALDKYCLSLEGRKIELLSRRELAVDTVDLCNFTLHQNKHSNSKIKEFARSVNVPVTCLLRAAIKRFVNTWDAGDLDSDLVDCNNFEKTNRLLKRRKTQREYKYKKGKVENMTRPSVDPKNKRKGHIFCFNSEEKANLDQLAKFWGCSKSETLRRAVNLALEEMTDKAYLEIFQELE